MRERKISQMKVLRSLTAIALILTILCSTMIVASAAGSGVYAPLLMRLSTRSGPSTKYDEPGTFFNNNYDSTTVRVLSKSWDNPNGIWWVQVEFENRGTPYRAYTGLKRVNVDISRVPEESVIGSSYMLTSCTAYWGPGYAYAAAPYDVPYNASVTVWDQENGFAQVEFYDSRTGSNRRAWVSSDCLAGNWGGGWNSGGSVQGVFQEDSSSSQDSVTGYIEDAGNTFYRTEIDTYRVIKSDTLTISYNDGQTIIFSVEWKGTFRMQDVAAYYDWTMDRYDFSANTAMGLVEGWIEYHGDSVDVVLSNMVSDNLFAKMYAADLLTTWFVKW